jgi:hypothetical protein
MVVTVVLTADEILAKGLELQGFERTTRQSKASHSLNVSRFKSFYGSHPIVYAQLWEDLQTTAIPEARVDARTTTIDYFLMSLYFLKCYPKESKLAGDFKIGEKTARTWIWDFFIKKIQALKGEKVWSMEAISLSMQAALFVTVKVLLSHS